MADEDLEKNIVGSCWLMKIRMTSSTEGGPGSRFYEIREGLVSKRLRDETKLERSAHSTSR